jgi:drug/metabolite transporter (DMT)-like permease
MILLTPVMALHPVRLDFWVVSSLLLLGGLGSGLAYIWNIAVLRAWGPTSSSTVTYLLPVVGILLGVLILHETLTWNEPVGALLVMLGIVFTQGRLKLHRRHRGRVDPEEVVAPST